MVCRNSNFWIGLGIGSVLGALAYRLSRTSRAKKLESDIYHAIRRVGIRADDMLEDAENKALRASAKAVEAGARVADKVAEKADKAAEKADRMRDKWDKIATEASKK